MGHAQPAIRMCTLYAYGRRTSPLALRHRVHVEGGQPLTQAELALEPLPNLHCGALGGAAGCAVGCLVGCAVRVGAPLATMARLRGSHDVQ